jgi:xanthine dehydrogenase accessory factor
MRVLVDPTCPEQFSAYAAAAEAVRNRRRGTLTTIVHGGERVDVRWEDSISGPDDAPRFEASVKGVGPQLEELIEPVIPAPLLLISGGGHVGQALARQAVLVGFEVVVVEDREAFSGPSLYPPGVDVRRGRFAELVREWPLNRDSYVAIVGRGHKVDADALAAAIGAPAGYVGMMGSRRKVALLRREFVESGLATAAQFDRVHAPIGLDIGAETVPEIAASIVAEMVAVRRGKRPEPPAREP